MAATFEALLAQHTINRRLARLAGVDEISEHDRGRLALLVALHDMGKVNRGFWNKASTLSTRTAGHIQPVICLLDPGTGGGSEAAKNRVLARFLEAIRAEAVISAFDGDADTANALLYAVLVHHGRLPAAGSVETWLWEAGRADCGTYEPMRELSQLADMALRWFPPPDRSPCPHLAEPRFLHAFAGLVMLADWLGSDTRWFPFPGEDGAPAADDDRLGFARMRATAMLKARHLAATDRARTARGVSMTFGATFPGLGTSPRPAQAAMLTLNDPAGGGRLVVLEAETGSGKTEAALLHFLRLLRADVVDGLYFALPTRAAAVQIHGRVSKAVRRILGDVPIGLAVPGYLRADDVDGARLPETFDVLWPDDPEDRMRDRGWAVEHPKRYLAGPVMVGTVDQLLMGGLSVRHAQLRSSAMLRQLLVIDEVHASDPYMERLLTGILDQHRAAGGHALLMSATLGAAMRVRLMDGPRATVPAHPDAVALPYPAVHVDRGAAPDLPREDASTKRVQVELDEAFEDDTGIATRALAAARQGARVLVLRNSVRRAQSLQRVLSDAAGEAGECDLLFQCEGVAAPHHARFAAEDRRLLDDALERAFSNQAVAGRGVVAVTTQTAEQSLDLDADLMVTDLCPADVLLQRLGRLHRHRRRRPPGFETARAVVLAPTVGRLASSLIADGSVRGPVMGLGSVYVDLLGIVATRRFLETNPMLAVPAMNRVFVEQATHPEVREALADELGSVWPAHAQRVWARAAAMFQTAGLVGLDWSRQLCTPWPPADLPPELSTRLGLDDRRIELPTPVEGPFGSPVSAFTFPGWMLSGVSVEMEALAEADGAGQLHLRIGESVFKYDAFGLRPG